MKSFPAFRILSQAAETPESDNKLAGRFVDMTLNELDPGEVTLRVVYSSVNYKDALAGTGTGRVIRRFPCVGGIDLAGVVEDSQDENFSAGDEVIVTGYGMGVEHDGGFAAYARVPSKWVVPLPKGLSLFEAMALGTAGFTAALAIHRLEQNELLPKNGKVIVTGATGGVGSLAIQMLSQLGYQVVAYTGKASERNYLEALGASQVLLRSEVNLNSSRPLESAQWAGALDAVGGTVLAWLLRSMQQNGVIASFGNAAGVELNTSVFPFILRGVRLLGIDSAATAMVLREKIWQRLASAPVKQEVQTDTTENLSSNSGLRPALLEKIAHPISFSQLPEAFHSLLRGDFRGRFVVKITG